MVNHWSYRLRTFGGNDYGLHIKNFVLQNTGKEVHNINMNGIIFQMVHMEMFLKE